MRDESDQGQNQEQNDSRLLYLIMTSGIENRLGFVSTLTFDTKFHIDI